MNPKKLSVQEVKDLFNFSLPIQIRFSDIDGYMHVNNGIYFSYFEHGRAAYLYQVCGWDVMEVGTVVANIQIDYLRPIQIFDKVEAFVRCSNIGNSSFVLDQYLLGKTQDGQERIFAHCICTMVSVNMKTMRPVAIPEEYRSKLSS